MGGGGRGPWGGRRWGAEGEGRPAAEPLGGGVKGNRILNNGELDYGQHKKKVLGVMNYWHQEVIYEFVFLS